MKHSGGRIFVVALLRVKLELFQAKSATGLIARLAATDMLAQTRFIAPFPPD